MAPVGVEPGRRPARGAGGTGWGCCVSSRLDRRPAAISSAATARRPACRGPSRCRRAGPAPGHRRQPGLVVGDVLVVVDGHPGGELVVAHGVRTDRARAGWRCAAGRWGLGRVDGLGRGGRAAWWRRWRVGQGGPGPVGHGRAGTGRQGADPPASPPASRRPGSRRGAGTARRVVGAAAMSSFWCHGP